MKTFFVVACVLLAVVTIEVNGACECQPARKGMFCGEGLGGDCPLETLYYCNGLYTHPAQFTKLCNNCIDRGYTAYGNRKDDCDDTVFNPVDGLCECRDGKKGRYCGSAVDPDCHPNAVFFCDTERDFTASWHQTCRRYCVDGGYSWGRKTDRCL